MFPGLGKKLEKSSVIILLLLYLLLLSRSARKFPNNKTSAFLCLFLIVEFSLKAPEFRTQLFFFLSFCTVEVSYESKKSNTSLLGRRAGGVKKITFSMRERLGLKDNSICLFLSRPHLQTKDDLALTD